MLSFFTLEMTETDSYQLRDTNHVKVIVLLVHIFEGFIESVFRIHGVINSDHYSFVNVTHFQSTICRNNNQQENSIDIY